jgi:hypothetical protein
MENLAVVDDEETIQEASSSGLPRVLGFDRRPPEQTKTSPMPGDHGFWFEDNQDLAPCRPKAAE